MSIQAKVLTYTDGSRKGHMTPSVPVRGTVSFNLFAVIRETGYTDLLKLI